MRSIVAAFLLCVAGQASAFGPLGQDISDLWWNPAESGWGMNVIQQSDISFVTLFVYGTNNAPTWYVASSVAYQGYDSANREHVHSGTLYQTTGPAYTAATFDPAQVGVRQVGLLTLRVGTSATTNTIYTGRVTYTVDGVTFNKAVERQAWRTANHAGTYYGTVRESWTQCSTSSFNGEYVTFGRFTVTQTSAVPPVLTIAFESSTSNFSYTFTGSYYQAGRNGVLPAGTVSTQDNSGNAISGRVVGTEITSGITGMSGTFALSALSGYTGCTMSVRVAAAQ